MLQHVCKPILIATFNTIMNQDMSPEFVYFKVVFAFVLPPFLLSVQSTSVCVRFCLFVCVRVCPHVLYALSACSQLIKTHCRLSCFPPACLPGGRSSTHQPPSTLPSCAPLTSPHSTSPLPHLPHYTVTQRPSLASCLPLTPRCSFALSAPSSTL